MVVFTGLPNYPDGKVFTDFIASRDAYSTLRNIKILRVPYHHEVEVNLLSY